MKKVTVSMPDPTEEQARLIAKRKKMNFSALVSLATSDFVKKSESLSITDAINDALQAAVHDDSNDLAARAGAQTLRASEW